jgi:hypothetical protein
VQALAVAIAREAAKRDPPDGKDTLGTDTSFDVDMSSSADTCKWDLRAVYDDKSAAKWRNIDPCKISSITLFYNAKTDVTSAKYK